MTNEKTSENTFVINESPYKIKKRKDGFWLFWVLTETQQNKIFSNSDFKISNIYCHMRIWNKIFYDKHRKSSFNSGHNEDIMLRLMREKITDIFTNEINSIEYAYNHNTGMQFANRYVLKENSRVGSKIVTYKYIIVHDKKNEKISIVSIYRSN